MTKKKKIFEIKIQGYENTYNCETDINDATEFEVFEAVNRFLYNFIKENDLKEKEYIKFTKHNFKYFKKHEREEN